MRIPALLTCTCALLAACDGTGPDDSVRVSIATNIYSRGFAQLDEQRIQISCDVEFTARAEGPAGTPIIWRGGERRWYAGADREHPVDVEVMVGSDVRAFWNNAALEGGGTATTHWAFWAEMPFIVRHEFRYTTGDSRREQTTGMDVECGLGAEVAPPVVTNFVMQAPTPVGPGDTLSVSFDASAAGGLWQTRVVVSGAFRDTVFRMESLEPAAERSVEITIPAGTPIGLPVVIHGEAVDGAGRVAASQPLQTAPLVDVVPPRLLRATTLSTLEPGVYARLVGQYAAGDTLSLFVISSDNHKLGELVIEIGGERIVREVNAPDLHEVITFPISSGWMGTPGLAVSVNDSVGLAGPRLDAHPDSIVVVPSRTPDITSTVVASRVRAAKWDEARNVLYLVNEEAPEVIAVSTASMSEVRRIPLPAAGGAGVDFTQSGDTLVVSLPDRHSIAVIDLATGAVQEFQVADAGDVKPDRVTVAADGSALIHLGNGMSVSLAAHVDLRTGAVLSTTTMHEGFHHILRYARNRDATTIVAHRSDGCLFVWSTATGSFGPCIASSNAHGTLSVNDDGTRVLLGRDNFDISARTSRPTHWGVSPLTQTHTTGFAADGVSVYVSFGSGIYRFRSADGRALERIVTEPWLGEILPSGDGTRLITIKREDPHYHIRISSIPLQ